MTVLPKAIYRFNAISIKIPVAFSPEIEKTILKFVWDHKNTMNSQNNLEGKQTNKQKTQNKTRGIRHNDFKLYYKNHSNQNSMVLAEKQIHGSTEQN